MTRQETRGRRRGEGKEVVEWTADLDLNGRFLPRGSPDWFEGGWRLQLEFTQVGGRLYPSRLELERGTLQDDLPDGGITARLFHSIKLGELVDAFRGEQEGDLAAEELFFDRPVRPRYELPPKANRGGPKGWGEKFYQDVAVAYLRALQEEPRSPVDWMVPSYPGYRKENVRDWVYRAREKGYLTSLGRGRAGGEATQKLKDAIRARTKEERRGT